MDNKIENKLAEIRQSAEVTLRMKISTAGFIGKAEAKTVIKLCDALGYAITGIECVCSPHSEGAPAEWLKKKEEQFKAKINQLLSEGK